MVLRALERMLDTTLLPPAGDHFADVDPASPHAGAISRLFELGVVYGRSIDAFDPLATLRRDGAASLLVRALQVWDGSTGPGG